MILTTITVVMCVLGFLLAVALAAHIGNGANPVAE
jgi:multisubunit Na+/H+ antiporter MnhC subunit